jgi:hypothetical protein
MVVCSMFSGMSERHRIVADYRSHVTNAGRQ